jgi:hypothetical protein
METTPICSIHNKYQTEHGEWFTKSEDFSEKEGITIIESPCDECS